MNKSDPILTEGHNCWRSAHADRVSLFDRRASLLRRFRDRDRTRRTVDHHSELGHRFSSPLRPQNEGQPSVIIDTLNRLVARNPRFTSTSSIGTMRPSMHSNERQHLSTLSAKDAPAHSLRLRYRSPVFRVASPKGGRHRRYHRLLGRPRSYRLSLGYTRPRTRRPAKAEPQRQPVRSFSRRPDRRRRRGGTRTRCVGA